MPKKARPTAPQKRGASPAPAPSPAATVALPGCPPPRPSSSAFDSDWPRLPSPIQPPSASDPSLASGGQPVPRNAPNLAAAPPPDPDRRTLRTSAQPLHPTRTRKGAGAAAPSPAAGRPSVWDERVPQAMAEIVQDRRFPTVEAVRVLLVERHQYVPPYVKPLKDLEHFLQTTNLIVDCYLAANKASTLWELHEYICQQSEELYGKAFDNFRKLGLGPLHRHPRVMQYFKPPPDLTQVPEVRARELYEACHDVCRKSRGQEITTEEVVALVAKRHSAEPEALCLYMACKVGFVITCMKRAREHATHAEAALTEHLRKAIATQMQTELQECRVAMGRAVMDRFWAAMALMVWTHRQLLFTEGLCDLYKVATHLRAFPGDGTALAAAAWLRFTAIRWNGYCPPPVVDWQFEPALGAEAALEVVGCEAARHQGPWLVKDLADLEAAVTAFFQRAQFFQVAGEAFLPFLRRHTDREPIRAMWVAATRPHTAHRPVQRTREEVEAAVLQRMEALARQGEAGLEALALLETEVVAYFHADGFAALGFGSFAAFLAARHRLSAAAEQLLRVALPTVAPAAVQAFVRQCVFQREVRGEPGGAAVEEAIQAQVCSHFNTPDFEHLNLGPWQQLTQGLLQPTGSAEPASPLPHGAQLLYAGALFPPAAAAGPPFGAVTRAQALAAVEAAPYLADLAGATQWRYVFQPALGRLVDFLAQEECRHLCVLEVQPGHWCRLPAEADYGAVQAAIQAKDGALTAALVLRAAATGSLADVALAEAVEVGLRAAPEDAGRLWLACVAAVPEAVLAAPVVAQVFLEPLFRVAGTEAAAAAYAAAPPELRRRLHALAVAHPLEDSRPWRAGLRDALALGANGGRALAAPAGPPPGLPAPTGEVPAEAAVSTAAAEPSVTDESGHRPLPQEEADDDEDEDLVLFAGLGHADHAGAAAADEAAAPEAVVREVQARLESVGPEGQRMIARFLEPLSTGLFSEATHFAGELVQNGDDCQYGAGAEPTVVFLLEGQGTRLTVYNNEAVGFTAKDMRALCDMNNSYKKLRENQIGKKGIGFKSCFLVTDRPEIHSNGFHVCFDKATHGDFHMIYPTLVPDRPSPDLSATGNPHLAGKRFTTRIVMPLKRPITAQRILSEIPPPLLLFLNNLRCIVVQDADAGAWTALRRTAADAVGTVAVLTHRGEGEGEVETQRHEYFVSSLPLQPKDHQVRRSDGAGGSEAYQSTTLCIACPVVRGAEALPDQWLYAYLPVRHIGLRFAVHADWELTSSREDVRDSTWNAFLRDHLPELLLSAFRRSKAAQTAQLAAAGGGGDAGEAAGFADALAQAVLLPFLRLLPVEEQVHHRFFRRLPQAVTARVRNEPCILTEGGEWRLPQEVLLCHQPPLRRLIPASALQRGLGKQFAHRAVCEALADSPALRRALGVPQLDWDMVITLLRSGIGRASSAADVLSTAREWLLCLHGLVEEEGLPQRERAQRWEALRALPLLPLAGTPELAAAAKQVFYQPLTKGVDLAPYAFAATIPVVDPLLLDSPHRAVLMKTLKALDVLPLTPEVIIDSCLAPPGLLPKEKPLPPQQPLGPAGVSALRFLVAHVVTWADDTARKQRIRQSVWLWVEDGIHRGWRRPAEDVVYFPTGLSQPGRCPSSGLAALRREFPDLLAGQAFLSDEYLSAGAGALPAIGWHRALAALGLWDCFAVRPVLDPDTELPTDFDSPDLRRLLTHLTAALPAPPASLQPAPPEFSPEVAALRAVAAHLAADWGAYRPFLTVPGTDPAAAQQGIPGTAAPASALYRLLTTANWLPGADGHARCPARCFLPTDDVRRLLDDRAPTCVVPLPEAMAHDLQLRTRVPRPYLLEALREWARQPGFRGGRNHMQRVYNEVFHAAQDDPAVAEVLVQEALVFLPDLFDGSLGAQHYEQHTAPMEGQFYSRAQLVWLDRQHLFRRHPWLGYRSVADVYSNALPFFRDVLGIPEQPDLPMLLDVWRQLSARPVADVGESVLALWQQWDSDLREGRLDPQRLAGLFRQMDGEVLPLFPLRQGPWAALTAGLVVVDTEVDPATLEEVGQQVPLLWLSRTPYALVRLFLATLLHITPLSLMFRSTVDYRMVHYGSLLESYVVRCVPLLQRFVASRSPQLLEHHGDWIREQVEQLRVEVVVGLRAGAELQRPHDVARTAMRPRDCLLRTQRAEDPAGLSSGRLPSVLRVQQESAPWTLYVDKDRADRYPVIFQELARLVYCDADVAQPILRELGLLFTSVVQRIVAGDDPEVFMEMNDLPPLPEGAEAWRCIAHAPVLRAVDAALHVAAPAAPAKAPVAEEPVELGGLWAEISEAGRLKAQEAVAAQRAKAEAAAATAASPEAEAEAEAEAPTHWPPTAPRSAPSAGAAPPAESDARPPAPSAGPGKPGGAGQGGGGGGSEGGGDRSRPTPSEASTAPTPDVQLYLSPTVTHGGGEGATEDRAERRAATNGHAAHNGSVEGGRGFCHGDGHGHRDGPRDRDGSPSPEDDTGNVARDRRLELRAMPLVELFETVRVPGNIVEGLASQKGDSNLDVAYWGEELVFRYLQQTVPASATVCWVNEGAESLKPYDIVVEDEGTKRYVEVKTTVEADRCTFQFSGAQYALAVKAEEHFEVWRVMKAGQPDPTVVQICDPIQHVRKGRLGLLLSI